VSSLCGADCEDVDWYLRDVRNGRRGEERCVQKMHGVCAALCRVRSGEDADSEVTDARVSLAKAAEMVGRIVHVF